MKSAGLILDHSPHYVDHLAPFCSLMNWPLIVCDEAIAELVRKYYPDVKLIQTDLLELHLPKCVVACDTRPMLNAVLGPFRPYQGHLIWLPHGLSDKGWKRPFFEALSEEELLLVYGQRMRDVLAAKEISIPQLSIGNFRWEYYEKHRAFYSSFFKNRFTLYAPTWEDSEKNGTFLDSFQKISAAIPDLLIKLHPNTEQRYAAELERHKEKHNFLENFPPIYPLLDHTDVLIGDMSSIGYDFLKFNKPMYFLRKEKTDPRTDPSSFLMQAGTQITLDELPTIETAAPQNNSDLLKYAFDETPDWKNNLQTIVDAWLTAQ